jgi:hypothetical protein
VLSHNDSAWPGRRWLCLGHHVRCPNGNNMFQRRRSGAAEYASGSRHRSDYSMGGKQQRTAHGGETPRRATPESTTATQTSALFLVLPFCVRLPAAPHQAPATAAARLRYGAGIDGPILGRRAGVAQLSGGPSRDRRAGCLPATWRASTRWHSACSFP